MSSKYLYASAGLTAEEIQKTWNTSSRWAGIQRNYTPEAMLRLRNSIHVEHTLATRAAYMLFEKLKNSPPVRALGALTGNQAVQQVAAGLEAIYLSGWQVAADANTAGQMYPDQSLYPVDSVPNLVRRINNALLRADQIDRLQNGKAERDWFAPIVADAEAGFGGDLNAFELMKAMIEAGAAGVHFEDQLSSAKKCGHMGGKVLVPTREFIRRLQAARLAADVLDVPTVLVARTDADSAKLITQDIDPVDRPFIKPGRTPEGFYSYSGGLAAAIARGLAYAPYADLLWMETSKPDIDEARKFAAGIHAQYPGKMLAYNCSPSFNWVANLHRETIEGFISLLGQAGYRFVFVTLAGFHSLNLSMFELARAFKQHGMTGFVDLQEREFTAQKESGFSAVKHQQFVGTGYFDEVAKTISDGELSTAALKDSTEETQF